MFISTNSELYDYITFQLYEYRIPKYIVMLTERLVSIDWKEFNFFRYTNNIWRIVF